MAARVLQINFKFNVPTADLANAFAPLVDDIAATPGLRWKVWIINEDENEAGGIYLFNDDASLQKYIGGPIVAGLMAHPALSDISAKQFDIIRDFTATTRGPV
ncbi:MAG: YdhR family protein [Candidatus Eisenbacteria bacterium]